MGANSIGCPAMIHSGGYGLFMKDDTAMEIRRGTECQASLLNESLICGHLSHNRVCIRGP